jgi:hypothetical protein
MGGAMGGSISIVPQILSQILRFGYEEGCPWGAKFQTRQFRLPHG